MVLLDRNWRCDAGEIDLVLRDGNVLVICEVKTRTSTDYGAPARGGRPAQGRPAPAARRAVAARARLPSRRRPHRPGGRAGAARGGRSRSSTSRGSADGLRDRPLAGPQGRRRPRDRRAGRRLARAWSAPRSSAGSTRACPRRATGCGWRSTTTAGGGPRPSGSRSCSRPPTCPRAAPTTTSRSPIAVMAADKKHEELTPDLLDGLGRSSASCRWPGALRPVPGVLPMVIAAAAHGITRVFVPEPQAAEAALVPGMTVFGVRSLAQVSAVLRGAEVPEAPPVVGPSVEPARDVARRGPPGRRRPAPTSTGWRTCASPSRWPRRAGTRSMLIGPRGTGKTSIAERIPTILPDLTTEQALEVTALHSVAGALPEGSGLLRRPPWFAPHHSATRGERARRRHRPGAARAGQPGPPRRAVPRRVPALPRRRHRGDAAAAGVGRGDHRPRRGVRHLSRPLAGRAGGQPVPVRQLPRPRPAGHCECTEVQRSHYRRKLTGPILDRVDIWMEVRPQGRRRRRGRSGRAPESSAEVRARVAEARQRQARRYRDCSGCSTPPAPGRSSPSAGRWSPRASALDRRGAVRRHAHPPRADPRPAAGLDRRRLLRGASARACARRRSPWRCGPTTPRRTLPAPGGRLSGARVSRAVRRSPSVR